MTFVFPLIVFIGFTVLFYSLLYLTRLVDGLRQEKLNVVLLTLTACAFVSAIVAYILHRMIKKENILKVITACAVGGLVSIVVAPINFPLWG